MNVSVRVICPCGNEWDDTIIRERDTGASYLDRWEECPECGVGGQDLMTHDLDEIDIQERKLEARGVDF
jgi:hypothetical protein